MWGHGVARSGSGKGQVAGICECGNELSGSIKCGGFLDQLRTGQLLKKDSAPSTNSHLICMNHGTSLNGNPYN